MLGSDEKAPGRLWRRARLRVLLLRVAFAALLTVAIIGLGGGVHQHMAAVEAWIAGLGPWGVVAFIGLFVVMTSVFVPDTVLAMVSNAVAKGVRFGSQAKSVRQETAWRFGLLALTHVSFMLMH